MGEIDDFGFICAKSVVLGCNFVQDIGAAGQLPECSLERGLFEVFFYRGEEVVGGLVGVARGYGGIALAQ